MTNKTTIKMTTYIENILIKNKIDYTPIDYDNNNDDNTITIRMMFDATTIVITHNEITIDKLNFEFENKHDDDNATSLIIAIDNARRFIKQFETNNEQLKHAQYIENILNKNDVEYKIINHNDNDATITIDENIIIKMNDSTIMINDNEFEFANHSNENHLLHVIECAKQKIIMKMNNETKCHDESCIRIATHQLQCIETNKIYDVCIQCRSYAILFSNDFIDLSFDADESKINDESKLNKRDRNLKIKFNKIEKQIMTYIIDQTQHIECEIIQSRIENDDHDDDYFINEYEYTNDDINDMQKHYDALNKMIHKIENDVALTNDEIDEIVDHTNNDDIIDFVYDEFDDDVIDALLNKLK